MHGNFVWFLFADPDVAVLVVVFLSCTEEGPIFLPVPHFHNLEFYQDYIVVWEGMFHLCSKP